MARKAARSNELEQIAWVLAGNEAAGCTTAAQSLGQCQAPHDMTTSYGKGGVGAKNNIHGLNLGSFRARSSMA